MWHWKLKIDNTNPTKTGCELGCSEMCRSSCSTSEARHHWQCSSANNLEQFWSILISVSDFVLLYTDRHGKKILRETHCHLFSEREFGDEYYYGIKYNIRNIYSHCMFWTVQLTNWPSITIILNIPDLQMNEYFYMKYKPNVIKYNYKLYLYYVSFVHIYQNSKQEDIYSQGWSTFHLLPYLFVSCI